MYCTATPAEGWLGGDYVGFCLAQYALLRGGERLTVPQEISDERKGGEPAVACARCDCIHKPGRDSKVARQFASSVDWLRRAEEGPFRVLPADSIVSLPRKSVNEVRRFSHMGGLCRTGRSH